MTDFRDTLGYRLVQLGRAAGSEYAARVGRLGLRPQHVRLLTAVQAAEHVSQNELAAELGVTPSFVVGLADDLERLGALTRERDSRDRRRQVLVLSPTGESLLRDATRAATELDRELARELAADALVQLRESLETVWASLASRSHDADGDAEVALTGTKLGLLPRNGGD
jgi:DNA-binding MarR family transcriptional regulator